MRYDPNNVGDDCCCGPSGAIRPVTPEDLARIRNMRGELLSEVCDSLLFSVDGDGESLLAENTSPFFLFSAFLKKTTRKLYQ